MKCQRSHVLSYFVIVSVLLGVSRGEALDVGSGCFQSPASLLDLKMGTTLGMCSFSEEFKVLTGLGAAPCLCQALTGFEAPGDGSLREFLQCRGILSFAGSVLRKDTLAAGLTLSEVGSRYLLRGTRSRVGEDLAAACLSSPREP